MQTPDARAGGQPLGRLLAVAAPAIALLCAGAWFQPSVAGSDLWWHLASGRELWRTRGFPHTDPFSYTFGGQPWTNHEWLWDILYWGLYRIHPELVAWFNLALLFAIYGLVFEVARRTSGSRLAAGVVVVAAAASAHWFLDIRPHLFTLLFVGIVLVFRDRPWAVWLWPPLMLVWINLHGGFVFGLGLIGLLVLFRTATPSLRERRLVIPAREWISLAICFGTLLCNPYGTEILAYPIAYLDRDSPFRSIIEWLPPDFSLNLRFYEGRFWLLVGGVACGYWLALRRQPFLAALAAVTFAMAATSRRFIPLFGVTGAPIAALALAELWRRGRALWPALRHPALAPATAALALLVGLGLWRDVRLMPRLLDRWTEHWFYPEAALSVLRALDPPERLLNYYNWGGYMMLHAPELRVFIDGRANTLYDEKIYTDYLQLLRGARSYGPLLSRYRIELVFMPTNSSLVSALLRQADPWVALYMDRISAILVPPDSPLRQRTLPADLPGPEHPERLLVSALTLSRAGRYDEAVAKLEEVIARDPLLSAAYGELALVHARRGDLHAMRAAIQRGIEADPREERALRGFEGRAYEGLGDLDRAIAAYRRALPAGPFSLRKPAEARIRELEARREGVRREQGG